MNENNKLISNEIKKIDLSINNNMKNQYCLYNQEKIRKSSNVRYGFNKGPLVYPPEIAIIDVGQCEYALEETGEVLITYGIVTCCGIIVTNDSRRVLMHIDATIEPDDVIKLLDDLELGHNVEITIVPGLLCTDFDYHDLILKMKNRSNECSSYKLTGVFGSIAVEQDKIKIRSEHDDETIEMKKNRRKI